MSQGSRLASTYSFFVCVKCRYEMQEVETMVTEWEEVEVEEESIEYQWTDKLTTMDTDKVFRHVEITIMRPGDCGSIRTTSYSSNTLGVSYLGISY